MKTEYNVGDSVWWATCGSKSVEKQCPICYGHRKVTLILGNGDEAILDCDFCKKGFDAPRGFITEYEWTTDCKQIVIDVKNIKESGSDNHREIEYRHHHYSIKNEELFATKEEAEARIVELIAVHDEELKKNLETRKEYNKNSYGWNAGYHKRCAEKARRDLEYHEKKVVFMKALARKPKHRAESTCDVDMCDKCLQVDNAIQDI